MANLPELTRDYSGFVLEYSTRTFDWLTLNASYTYSDSKGSQEYTQNAGVDFDVYPAHFENRYGLPLGSPPEPLQAQRLLHHQGRLDDRV